MDPRLLRFYNEHLERFGTRDARGVGWRDESSQQNRFKVLTEIADLTNASILDEGCGFGDLFPYLTERFSGIKYIGIDVNPRAIEAARERYPDAAFEIVDFTEYTGGPFEYVLSSGALTFHIENHQEIYAGHIRKMYDLCTKGVAFNVLDRHAITENDEYVGYEPDELVAFCKTFASRVELRHDYSPEDFTIYLYRETYGLLAI